MPPPPEPVVLTPAPETDGVVDFSALTVESYASSPYAQDLTGGATVADGGRTLVLSGNTWKKVALPTDITAGTTLEFDLFVVGEGEIQGLGFDNDNAYAQDATFELAGTTTWGIQDYTGAYTVGEDGWVHYEIHKPEPHILLFRRPLGTDPQTGMLPEGHPLFAQHMKDLRQM